MVAEFDMREMEDRLIMFGRMAAVYPLDFVRLPLSDAEGLPIDGPAGVRAKKGRRLLNVKNSVKSDSTSTLLTSISRRAALPFAAAEG